MVVKPLVLVSVLLAARPLRQAAGEGWHSNLRAFDRLSYKELMSDCLGRKYVHVVNAVLALAIDDCLGNVTFRNEITLRNDNDTIEDVFNDLDEVSFSTILDISIGERRNNRDKDGDDRPRDRDRDDDRRRDQDRDNDRRSYGDRDDDNRRDRDRDDDRRRDQDRDSDRRSYGDRDDDNRRDRDRDDDRRRDQDRDNDRRSYGDRDDSNRRDRDRDDDRKRDRDRDDDRRRDQDRDNDRRSYGDRDDDNRRDRDRDDDRRRDRDRDDDRRTDRDRDRDDDDFFRDRDSDVDRNQVYGYGFFGDENRYENLEDGSFFGFEDTGLDFYREKRTAFRPDLTSISDLLRREIALEEKFLNFACIQRRRLEIINSDDIRKVLGGTINVDKNTADEYMKAMADCNAQTNCLKKIYPSSNIFPPSLRELIELGKCQIRQLRLVCIKSDLRNLLPRSSIDNGTLAEIFEDLLNKLVDIVSVGGELQSSELTLF